MKLSKAPGAVIVGLVTAVALLLAGCASSEAGKRKGEVQPPPKPVNSQVRRARCKGLVKTRAKVKPASRCPSWRALRSPRSVNGRSVLPVCWPETVQAVSPCRAR